jgi:hypothetical protein
MALVRTDVRSAEAAIQGYGPSDLQSAYNLPVYFNGIGQTVAIVDPLDDPNAEADMVAYRQYYMLPTCTTSNGCFKKLNEAGVQGQYPPGSTDFGLEISLDLDVVSASCPNCKIILVEANSEAITDLGMSVDTAVAAGGNPVSNSYECIPASSCDSAGTYYNHPNVIITASAGDNGYGTGFPMDQNSVISVGGTTLTAASNPRGWTETVWSGTGSGCTNQPKPAWQNNSGCAFRTSNDVATVADPMTGVAVYDTYGFNGWLDVGGTSIGAPLIASVYALAGNASSLTYAQSLYQNPAGLYDIKTGSNGHCSPDYLCQARVGYDGPSGNGTPKGTTAF